MTYKFVLGQPVKQPGELFLHLAGVFGVEVENLFTRCGVEAAVLLYMVIQTGQVFEPQLMSQGQHLRLGFSQLFHTNLMNLAGRQVGGGHATDGKAVTGGTVRQSPHAGIGTAVGRVISAHEGSEFLIRGKYFLVDCSQDSRAQACLLGSRDGCGKRLHRFRKWTRVPTLAGDVFCLQSHFLEQKAGRHEPVFHPLAHVVDGLIERMRDLVQARKIVLVVFHRVERHERAHFDQ